MAPTAAAAADISRQPLPIIQQNPAMTRYFDPRPTSAAVLAAGRAQLRLQTHYSSIFLADQLPTARRYLADLELLTMETTLRYGLGHRSDLTLNLPAMRPLAGALDRFLHRYHRALNLPNGGRELRPNNQFSYFYQGGWRGKPQWELGNLQLTLRSRLVAKRWALLLGVRLPTASRARGWGHPGADLALGSVLSWQRGRWFAHGEGWWVHPVIRRDSGMGVRDYPRASATVGRGIAWFAAPLNLLLQAQGGGSPYRSGVAALDSPPWLISVGLRGASHQGWQWNAAFVENITQSSTQDFSLSFGVTMPM